ncbi:MAG TPA: ATP-binding cassette domain-containing protein, partial [Thermomicrobiales bacterium]|nr:ATP-binding cassette domain-containing protein [Thermomicrobiales bacterium]
MQVQDEAPRAATLAADGDGVDPALWGEHGRRVQFLGRVGLFQGCDRAALGPVATALKPVAVEAGGVVVREGEPGDRFYLVESGKLAILVERGGEPRQVAQLGPGEFFGEMALLGAGGHRTATVRADTAARLWALAAEDFRGLLAHDPSVASVLRRAARLRASDAQLGVLEAEQRNLAALARGRASFTIGRDPGNDLALPSRVVSRYHAVLEQDGATSRLRDLGSANGTTVNGEPIESVALADGDEIWIGDQRLVFDHRQVAPRAAPRGIRVEATDLRREVRGGKQLLHDISLAILPGELVAIVGRSGAGKTTLLDALSGVHPATGGTVRYDGRDYYRDLARYRAALGYVPQDDIIHTALPVRRTLAYAARLRLPPDTAPADLAAAVDQTLASLNLTAHAGTRVRDLSGGQRKRASIGVELLTRPRVFFLDEPTSGLDPATDAQMTRLLRRLADEGSTVVLTTHATRNALLCDKLVFLARGGYLAFVGSPQRALEYFQADTLDQIYERLDDEATPEVWARRFRESADYARAVPPPPDGAREAARSAARPARGPHRRGAGVGRQLRQFAVLSRRSLDILTLNPPLLISLLVQPLAITVLMLLLFRSGAFSASYDNPFTASLILFFLSFSAIFFGVSYGTPEICKEGPIFRRERMVNLGIGPYLGSKLAILGPILIVNQVVMLLVLRATGRLPDHGLDVYGPLALTQILTTFAGLTFSLLISASIAAPDQALQLQPAVVIPQMLFSGAIVAVPTMLAVSKVISAVMIGRWSYEADGHLLDLNGLWQSSVSPMGRALLAQYGDTFTRGPALSWWIIGGFAAACLALT